MTEFEALSLLRKDPGPFRRLLRQSDFRRKYDSYYTYAVHGGRGRWLVLPEGCVGILEGEGSAPSRAVQILCSEIGGKTGELFAVSRRRGRRDTARRLRAGRSECESCTRGHGGQDNRGERRRGGRVLGIQSPVSWSATGMFPYAAFDKPDFPFRGFYQDITRGRVNRLSKLFRDCRYAFVLQDKHAPALR